jgi:hypothetical protein
MESERQRRDAPNRALGPDMRYRHTQIGKLSLLIVLPSVTLAVWAVPSSPARLVFLLTGAAILLLMSALTVTVTDDNVRVTFGIGVVRRTIPLARIGRAAVVRNRWYYGWGIRFIGHGWLWSVSGLDGVELSFVDGGRFRIGSDEPQRLAAAIEAALE